MKYEFLKNGFLGTKNPPIKKTRVIIIPFGLEHSVSYGKGTSNGPKEIIKASHQIELYDEELNYEPYEQIGIRTLKSKNIPKKTNMALNDLEKRVLSVIDMNKLPITLGGEHTISISSIRALKRKFKNFTIVHFDAHADIRNSYQGKKNSHACVMRRCMEIADVEVVSIGIRSLSKKERDFFEDNKNKIKIFWAKDKKKWKNIEKHIKGKNVYITFDLDAFDPSLIPATGTPEPGGLFWDEAIKIVKAIVLNSNIIGVDINELAPIKGMHSSNFIAAKLCYKIISYVFHYKKDNKRR